MVKTHVAVLRGGPSKEYDVSLQTGGNILKHLPEKYHVYDVLISREGVWHLNGIEREPHRILRHIDVVVNAMHGEYGEDGKVQQILQKHGVPYTGSDPLGSAVGMNKALSKKIFKQHNLKTPYHIVVESSPDVRARVLDIHKSFPNPRVVKPIGSGSSVGVTVAKTLGELESALLEAWKHSPQALVEEYISGKEATCGVIENFRGEPLYALLPVEVRPRSSPFFDYASKYTAGGADEICPGNFSQEEKAAIQFAAKMAHLALGLRHYSRSDFRVHPKRGIYILETNTLPGLTNESLFPKSLEAVGCKLSDFLDHLISLALKKTDN